MPTYVLVSQAARAPAASLPLRLLFKRLSRRQEPGPPAQGWTVMCLVLGISFKAPGMHIGHDNFDSSLGINRRLILQSAEVTTAATDRRSEMLATCPVSPGNVRGS